MFLFTTPTPTGPAANVQPSPVIDAIRQGADQTGTPFDYLLKTAQRESALNPVAKAPTSSAAGLFQFIEQTWLGMVKTEGANVGLGDLPDAISARTDGTYTVSDPDARQSILKLREDPKLASTMAGLLTQQNRSSLSGATGRDPSSGELYMAHVLGPRGAADLIRVAGSSPSRPFAPDMPEAAAANRPIFYDRQGNARGAGEVYALLSANAGASPEASSRSPVPTTVTGQTASGLRGLFQTGTRTGPVSDAVAKIWRVNNTAVPSSTGTTAAAFFPRSGEGQAASLAVSEVSETVAADPIPVTIKSANVPLPPPRPADLWGPPARRLDLNGPRARLGS